MKKIILVSFFFCLPVMADVTLNDQDIKRTCLQHSTAMVRDMNTNIISLSEQEKSAAIKLANKSCHSYFGRIESSVSTNSTDESSVAKNENNKVEDESKDWFTDYVINGNPHDKAGVKRLKKHGY